MIWDRTGIKIMVGTAVIAVALAILQRTSLALFPPNIGDFVQGLAIGVTFALVVVWISNRFGAVRK